MKAQVTNQDEPKKTPKEELMDLVKKMVESTYIDQPEDVALYFLNWLKKEKGFMTYSHENMVFICPPLIITQEQLLEELEKCYK